MKPEGYFAEISVNPFTLAVGLLVGLLIMLLLLPFLLLGLLIESLFGRRDQEYPTLSPLHMEYSHLDDNSPSLPASQPENSGSETIAG